MSLLNPNLILVKQMSYSIKINNGDSKPIKQPMRRLSLNKREIAVNEIKAMLENKITEPSTSPWASPIVLVSKRNGSTRFCTDFRAVNTVKINDLYPLPNINDCFDALQGTEWFSIIALQKRVLA